MNTTKNYIEAFSQTVNSRFGDEFSPNGKLIKVVKGGEHNGTWMERSVALKFAAWLDPEFELWVYSTIERLLFGKHVEREQSMERTIALQKEMSDIKDKEVKTGEDFDRYLVIERLLNHEKAVRKSLTTESISEMKSLFDQENEQE